MDADRLGRGEQIAGICAAVLFIVMFFNWFSLPGGDQAEAVGIDIDTGLNAWQSYDFTDLILLVTIVVAVGGAIATMMARDVALPVAASAITAGLGILSFVFVAFSILNTPSFGALGVDVDTDRSWGVFVGLLLTAGIAYGGWMSMQEEGTTFGDQVDRTSGGGGAPPPPPPPPTQPPAAGGPPAGGPPPA
jgi:hypothetical protein